MPLAADTDYATPFRIISIPFVITSPLFAPK